ncbi:MAG: AsmA-like C-terminal domain-containing protein [Pseudomonadota bacterium]
MVGSMATMMVQLRCGAARLRVALILLAFITSITVFAQSHAYGQVEIFTSLRALPEGVEANVNLQKEIVHITVIAESPDKIWVPQLLALGQDLGLANFATIGWVINDIAFAGQVTLQLSADFMFQGLQLDLKSDHGTIKADLHANDTPIGVGGDFALVDMVLDAWQKTAMTYFASAQAWQSVGKLSAVMKLPAAVDDPITLTIDAQALQITLPEQVTAISLPHVALSAELANDLSYLDITNVTLDDGNGLQIQGDGQLYNLNVAPKIALTLSALQAVDWAKIQPYVMAVYGYFDTLNIPLWPKAGKFADIAFTLDSAVFSMEDAQFSLTALMDMVEFAYEPGQSAVMQGAIEMTQSGLWVGVDTGRIAQMEITRDSHAYVSFDSKRLPSMLQLGFVSDLAMLYGIFARNFESLPFPKTLDGMISGYAHYSTDDLRAPFDPQALEVSAVISQIDVTNLATYDVLALDDVRLTLRDGYLYGIGNANIYDTLVSIEIQHDLMKRTQRVSLVRMQTLQPASAGKSLDALATILGANAPIVGHWGGGMNFALQLGKDRLGTIRYDGQVEIVDMQQALFENYLGEDRLIPEVILFTGNLEADGYRDGWIPKTDHAITLDHIALHLRSYFVTGHGVWRMQDDGIAVERLNLQLQEDGNSIMDFAWRYGEDEQEGTPSLHIRASTMDIGPYLQPFWDAQGGEGNTDPAEFSDQSWAFADFPPVKLDIEIDDLVFGDRGHIENLTVHMDRRTHPQDPHDIWNENVQANGLINGRYAMQLAYFPVQNGQYDLMATFDNIGPLLWFVGAGAPRDKGRVELSGRAQSRHQPIDGRIVVRDFVVTKKNFLSRLLQAISVVGAVSAITDDALSFRRVDGVYQFDRGHILLDHVVFSSLSIGIYAEGNVWLGGNWLDLQGNIAPANLINEIVDSIPLLGNLISKAGKQPIVATNYQARGSISNPDIAFNPASLILPGRLREIFSGPNIERDSEPLQ